jgi:hypothetical protein
MKSGTIHSKWFAMTKAGRMDAPFWMSVLETAKARNVDTNDDDAMRQLIRELDGSSGHQPQEKSN